MAARPTAASSTAALAGGIHADPAQRSATTIRVHPAPTRRSRRVALPIPAAAHRIAGNDSERRTR